MGIYTTKSQWQKALHPVVAFCVKRHIHPDIFTYGALALSGIAGGALLFAGTQHLWLWLVPPCVLLRLLLNLMDGQVARALGLADAWGEVKNEYGDRLADTIIFLGLGFGGYTDARLVGLSLALILGSSYLGILSKALGGPRVYRGLFGKGDRMISLAIFTLYVVLSADTASYNLYLGLATIAAAITTIQRLRIIYEYTQSLH